MSLSYTKITEILAKEPKFRTRQALNAIFSQSLDSWNDITVLPKNLRAQLEQDAPLFIDGRITDSSSRKSQKATFHFDKHVVESVLMKHEVRNTVCVSSQVGCPLACKFCYTGTLDFTRNLTSDEIINQVLFFNRSLRVKDERVTNVVFMGMGEPFLNYDAVLGAVQLLNNPDLFNIGARKISISTVGIIPGIERLTNEPLQVNLSVSLHAPDNDLRSKLMPVNKKYPLPLLLQSIRNYITVTNRKVMIEYTLLKDINSSPEQAKTLAGILKKELKHLFMINLIQYNQTGAFYPVDQKATEEFKKILEDEGLTVIERYRFGRDIKAACGQLAGKQAGKEK